MTFLDGLRHATGADYAIMNFRPPGRKLDQMLHLLSGDAPLKIRQIYTEYPTAPMLLEGLSEGRPYSLKELLRFEGGSQASFYREFVLPKGITAVRQMRVREATGVNAWLSIVRRGKDFPSTDVALLRSIGPVLRGVLRHYVASEQERFAATLTAEAVRRLQFGWLTLDGDGHVLGCDKQGALTLASSNVLSTDATGRLVARPAKLEREIYRALSSLAITPRRRACAITLRRDPWLDMLLVPAPRTSVYYAKAAPAVIAYVHGDSWRSTDRCEQLAELFALSPSEARLALAFCRGLTIPEAATQFKLTIGTVRAYSKSIYAKTGARGMPDLVRIVMRSVLAIVPEV
jgi:DNA-binding CsgD family transcriptional regulator